MTSPFEYTTKGWATFSRGSDMEGAERMYALLKKHDITPAEFLTYGENKTFLDTQMIDASETVAFHRGHFIGNINAVKYYLLLRDPDETRIG